MRITRHTRRDAVFPGSSAVEHSTVNRQVAGSNPARGAKFKEALFSWISMKTGLFYFISFSIIFSVSLPCMANDHLLHASRSEALS